MARIIYTPPGEKGWQNDTSPAINETNLNHIEKELRELIEEVNEYVADNETALSQLKSGSHQVLPIEKVDLLYNIDTLPTSGSSHLVTSDGIATQIRTETNNLLTQVTEQGKKIEEIEKVFPEGKVKDLATVATSGSYNDLQHTLEAGDNITITKNGNRNIISSQGGGGGSMIPVQSDIPVQKTGEIWFRTFEN